MPRPDEAPESTRNVPLCSVCGSQRTRRLFGKRVRGEELEVYECTACTHGFLSYRPAGFDDHLYGYYQKLLSQPRERRQTPLNARRYRTLLGEWGAQVEGRRLLDVGCGDGHMVRVANEDGWKARGIDMSEEAIAVAQAWGIACSRTDFFDRTLDEARFDVIFMSELIEHVPHPGRFLARAEALLAPGGLIHVTTPNFDSLTRRVLGADWSIIHSEHISYFRPRSLATLVRLNTLLSAQIETRNTSPTAIARRFTGYYQKQDTSAAAPPTFRGPDKELRTKIYASPLLTRATHVANTFLSATSLGDTIVATMR